MAVLIVATSPTATPAVQQRLMRFVRPELRVIDEDTWNVVQERLQAIHRKYTSNPREKP